MSNLAVDNNEYELMDENTFVTILLKDELYGIHVNKVQEVLAMEETARVPNTLPFLKGVINVRGEIIPIIDLRIKFELGENDSYEKSVILISEIEDKLIGLIVDAVSDVTNIPDEQIQRTVHFSANVKADCVMGISEVNDKIVIVIDVNKLFTEEELDTIKNSDS